MPQPSELQAAVLATGGRLLDLMEAAPEPALFSRKGAFGKLMEWSMRDPDFKVRLFRFVDVAPSLDSPADLIRHLREYLGEDAAELNPALRGGLAVAGFAPALVAAPVKAQMAAMARLFVAGDSPADLIRHMKARAAEGIALTVDLLGERVVSEREADAFLRRNIEVLDTLGEAVRKGAAGPLPRGDEGPAGPLPRVNLSVKVSALTPELLPTDPEGGVARLAERMRTILRRAAQTGAFVNFDMEHTGLKSLTLDLFRTLFSEPEFASAPACGIAIQAYLRDSEEDLRSLIEWARARHRPITVRLVKGAYWDYETLLARQRGWPCPVWSRKAESDLNFEKLSVLLLDNSDLVTPAYASHNVRSCAHVIAQAARLGVPPEAYEFQALYGMADPLKTALAGMGHRVREYAPVGELLPGMAYLVRRLLENTSNEGFLRSVQTGTAREILLAEPRPEGDAPARGTAEAGRFVNVPNTDFTDASRRLRMRSAVTAARRAPTRECPIRLASGARKGAGWIETVSPSDPSLVVARCARASVADADEAVAAARASQPAWAARPAAERCAIIERAAELLEQRRFELSALEVMEAGKPWMEADADISEAVDFCRYYAAEMRRLSAGAVTQPTPGEDNRLFHRPRGVCAAIAPWNFPIAIPCGMVVAPLVAGNAVVLKPAEQAGACAAALADILLEAGVPAGAFQFLPGHGEDVGARLVAHPQVDVIVFTGSREVGLRIWEAAGRTAPGQSSLRKVVCEMGGKNAMIVDAGADLDEAVPAALYSAFGYAGQKCSALSRLILPAAVHDEVLARLVEAAGAVTVGASWDPGTVVPPVIDRVAQERLLERIGRAADEGRVAFRGRVPESAGWYVPPVIVSGVKPSSWLAREELFGPVLAVLKARDFDEALALANDSDYALTGGLFSRSPEHIRRARTEFQVGNLYINRPVTGAIVERHPFGGFRMSGGGTKAGGPGYLENFMVPCAISENTLRRGFAPEV